MPKPAKFSYEKKDAFRDAAFCIIICEGSNREPAYFRFFDGLSSRVKIIAVESSEGHSSPSALLENAAQKEEELGASAETDTLWFVLDTDKWSTQLHALREQCRNKKYWTVVQSNPCFEVWLFFHAQTTIPPMDRQEECKKWKSLVPKLISGGFNADYHCVWIETAIKNAKAAYKENGYEPEPGSTQVWRLGEVLLSLLAKDLAALKVKFPPIITNPLL